MKKIGIIYLDIDHDSPVDNWKDYQVVHVNINYDLGKIRDDHHNIEDHFLSSELKRKVFNKSFTRIIIRYNKDRLSVVAKLLLLIRLSENPKDQLIPILCWSESEFFSLIKKSSIFSILPKLQVENVYVEKFNPEEKSQYIRTFLENPIPVKADVFEESMENIELSLLKPTKYSSHQVTNEWAAFKLAYDGRLIDLLSILEEKQPRSKTIYFQYLKYKYKIDSSLSDNFLSQNETNMEGKYLLIDDNFEKGWATVFSEIFKREEGINLEVEPYQDIKVLTRQDTIEEIIRKEIENIKAAIDSNKYEGILLDLRITLFDDDPKNAHTNIDNFAGGKILQALKKEYPHIPVIMTTASNKAWNMRQLMDLGADGYFIKEDPESFPSPEVSRANYESFINLIKKCKEKHRTLSPFWKNIQQIEREGTLIMEKEDDGNGTQTKVEKRLKERLKMFFGLLKRSFEDKSFNKQFFYSDKKLAFMTLWSCLNEIQYAHLEKRPNGLTEIHPDLLTAMGVNLPTNLRYFQRKRIRNVYETYIKENWSNRTFEKGQLNKGKDRNKSIGHQIAYLIIIFSQKAPSIESTYLENLFNLKDKRNRLYLTHGDESSSTFFFKTEEEQNDISLRDCADLFEIVYFLLKSEVINVNI